VFARDSNGVLELELNEDVDGLLQSKWYLMMVLCGFVIDIAIGGVKVWGIWMRCLGKENPFFHFKWKGQGCINKVVDIVMVEWKWLI
jgi:hypothetical protein